MLLLVLELFEHFALWEIISLQSYKAVQNADFEQDIDFGLNDF
jgi:hypothetical protein